MNRRNETGPEGGNDDVTLPDEDDQQPSNNGIC